MVLSLFPFYRGGKRSTERLNNLPMVAQLVMTALEPTGKHNTHHCHNMRFLTPLKKKENFSTLILLNYSATNDCCPRHYYKTCKSLGFPPLFLDGRSPFLWDFWFFPSFPLVCGDSCMALPFLSGFTFYGSYYQPLIRKLLKICVYNPEFQTDFPECKHQDRESCLFSSVIYVHPLCLAHGRCPLNMC